MTGYSESEDCGRATDAAARLNMVYKAHKDDDHAVVFPSVAHPRAWRKDTTGRWKFVCRRWCRRKDRIFEFDVNGQRCIADGIWNHFAGQIQWSTLVHAMAHNVAFRTHTNVVSKDSTQKKHHVDCKNTTYLGSSHLRASQKV